MGNSRVNPALRAASGSMLRTWIPGLLLTLLFMQNPALAAPTVLTFDDLAPGFELTGSTYAGLIWEEGNVGDSGFHGRWGVPGGGNPHSLPRNIANAFGATEMGITFPSEVAMAGTYIAVQGNGSSTWAYSVRVRGFRDNAEVGLTDWFTNISQTPAWFDLSTLENVDRIVFEAQPVPQWGLAYYGLDDLTFTYIPEPAGMSLGLLAAGGMLLRRRPAEKCPQPRGVFICRRK